MAVLTKSLSSSSSTRVMSSVGLRRSIRRCRAQFLGHVRHVGKTFLHVADLLQAAGVIWLVQAADNLLDHASLVEPLLEEWLGRRLLGICHRHRLERRLAVAILGLCPLRLSLATFGGLCVGAGWRRAASTAVIVVHALHVVSQIPLTRESAAWNSALTALVDAKEGLVAMSVQSMGLALVSQQASS